MRIDRLRYLVSFTKWHALAPHAPLLLVACWIVAAASAGTTERVAPPNVYAGEYQRVCFALSRGAEVFVCQVVRRAPGPTSDQRVERRIELRVARVLKGRRADTITLAYDRRLTVTGGFPIWPRAEAALGEGAWLLCVVVPGGYNPVAEPMPPGPPAADEFDDYLLPSNARKHQEFDGPRPAHAADHSGSRPPALELRPFDGAASYVAALDKEDAPPVRAFEAILQLEAADDAGAAAALRRVAPSAEGLVASYVADAVVLRVAPRDEAAAAGILSALWQRPPGCGDGPGADGGPWFGRRSAAGYAAARFASDASLSRSARLAAVRLMCRMLAENSEGQPGLWLMCSLSDVTTAASRRDGLSPAGVLPSRRDVRELGTVAGAFCASRNKSDRQAALQLVEWLSDWHPPGAAVRGAARPD